MLTIFEDTVFVFSSVVTSPASSATSSSRKVLFSLRLYESRAEAVYRYQGYGLTECVREDMTPAASEMW